MPSVTSLGGGAFNRCIYNRLLLNIL